MIAHNSLATGQDDIQRCFINNTPLMAEGYFYAGTVMVWDCLFAGPVPAMPASVLTTGDQQAYAGTRFAFTAVLLETCLKQVPAEWVGMPGKSRSPIVTVHKCGLADASHVS